MSKIHQSFPPFVDANSKILILGTMPGMVSLEQQRYYGHPQNAFWKIMFEALEKPFDLDYDVKRKLLKEHCIALWDVLQNCEREGSLDSKIVCEVPNDFKPIFKNYPNLKTIVFNGQLAFKYYKKYIGLEETFMYHVMPSTSPANAGKSYIVKLNEWKQVLDLVK